MAFLSPGVDHALFTARRGPHDPAQAAAASVLAWLPEELGR